MNGEELYKLAKEYLDKNDKETAAKHLENASNLNHPFASHLYHRLLLEFGKEEESIKMLYKASNQGSKVSSFEIAAKILNGKISIDKEKKFEEIEKYLLRSLEETDTELKPYQVIGSHILARQYLQNNPKKYAKEILKLLELSSSIHYPKDKSEVYYYLSNYQLGILYLDNSITTKDLNLARGYLERASFGISDALVELALLDMEQNPESSIDHLTKAEHFNNPLALYLKATLLQSGRGIEKNPTEAEKLFKKSSAGLKMLSQKQPPTRTVIFAIQFYASLLFHGITTEGTVEKVKAGKLMKQASDLQSAEASYIYAGWLDKGYVRNDEGLEQAQAVFNYYKRAVVIGYPPAFTELAKLYSSGKGVEVDYKKSNEILTFAAERGSPLAMMELGVRCQEGSYGVESNEEKAVQYLLGAAKKGQIFAAFSCAYLIKNNHPQKEEIFDLLKDSIKKLEVLADGDLTSKDNVDALYAIGQIYLKGLGVDVDELKGINLLLKASDAGHVSATLSIALCYQRGLGVPVDHQKSISLLESISNASPRSNFLLGKAYQLGKGVDRDFGKAKEYFEKAASHGDTNAENALRSLSFF